MEYTDRHGVTHQARKTVCAECGKAGIADAETTGPTICVGCRMFGRAFHAAMGGEIDRRERLTQDGGLYRSKVSRTPDCGYIRDEGPTVNIDGQLYCICEDCVSCREIWSENCDSLIPETPEDCLA